MLDRMLVHSGGLTQFSQQLGSSTDMHWVAGASAGDTEVIRLMSQLSRSPWSGERTKQNKLISIFPEKRSGTQKGWEFI